MSTFYTNIHFIMNTLP